MLTRARLEPLAGPIHEALGRLIGCYFDPSGGSYMRIGCKAYLLELLFHLSRHFAGAEIAHSEYVKQQERALRLGRELAALGIEIPLTQTAVVLAVAFVPAFV